jgi:transposase
MPLIEAIPGVRGRRGRPRRRPGAVYADRGYDHDKYRTQVRGKGITPVIARRSTGHGSGLGTYRWVIEQSLALLHWFRRLRVRWEIRDDIHEAFLSLACAIICFRRLQSISLTRNWVVSGRAAADPGMWRGPVWCPGGPAAGFGAGDFPGGGGWLSGRRTVRRPPGGRW